MERENPFSKGKSLRIKQIESAAQKIFLKKGYRRATVGEIAKLAGVGKGTIYLYFKNKEDLFIAYTKPVFIKLHRKLVKFENELNKRQEVSCRDIIMGLFKIHYSLHQEDPKAMKHITSFYQSDILSTISDRIRKEINYQTKENFAIVRKLLVKALKLESSKETNVIQLGEILWTVFVGMVQFEEAKFQATKKYHLHDTLEYAYSLIASAISHDVLRTKSRR